MEFLQSYTFTIKHKKVQTNKFFDVLRGSLLTIQEIQLESIGVESFKDLYAEDKDFSMV